MRLKICFLFIFGCYFFANAENSSKFLTILAKDGTKVAYALAEQPVISFTESDLIILVKGVEVNYPLSNVVRFTYESSSETAINDLQTDEWSFKLNGESLLFPSLKANSSISIYSLNGAILLKKTVSHDGEYAFPIYHLTAGVYIVEINGLTYKIVKR